MEGILRNRPGGIIGLRAFIADHAEAVQYELLRMGLRLEYLPSKKLTWWDIKAILLNLPGDSAVHRAVQGDDANWTLTDQLLAQLIDDYRMANHGKGPKPEPIPRPGTRKPQFAGKGIPIDDMKQRLGW